MGGESTDPKDLPKTVPDDVASVIGLGDHHHKRRFADRDPSDWDQRYDEHWLDFAAGTFASPTIPHNACSDLLTKPAYVRAQADLRLIEDGRDPDAFSWIGNSSSPNPPSVPYIKSCPTLVDQFETAHETLWYYWEWLVHTHVRADWSRELDLAGGIDALEWHGDWEPMTRQWLNVMPMTMYRMSPREARFTRSSVMRPDRLAGVEAIAALAQHPAVLRVQSWARQLVIHVVPFRITSTRYGGSDRYLAIVWDSEKRTTTLDLVDQEAGMNSERHLNAIVSNVELDFP